MGYLHCHATVAGTFDHLHAGHRQLLQTAFQIAPQVSLGLAHSSFIKCKAFPQRIESFAKRRQAVCDFLRREGLLGRARIFSLKDVYGPACQDETLDAIVVSPETLAGAFEVNKARSAKGWPPLRIVKIAFVRGNDGEIVRSSRIRAGEIDREGCSYLKIFNGQLVRSLPQSLKSRLRRPLGLLIRTSGNSLLKTARQGVRVIQSLNPAMVVAVGDVVSLTLAEADFEPNVTVTDGKVRRRPITDDLRLKKRPTGRAENQPGTINHQAVRTYRQLLLNFFKRRRQQRLFIQGEEDLMALPAILLSPLGAVVVYGQYNLGIVVVPVTEAKKTQTARLMIHFL